MKTIYRLTMPNDCEGRSSRTIGYFSSEQDAEAVGETQVGNLAMGDDYGRITNVVLYTSVDDFCQNAGDLGAEAARRLSPDHLEDLKKSALAKLNAAEREALGL